MWKKGIPKLVKPMMGTSLHFKGWRHCSNTENTISVGEKPEELIIIYTFSKALRDWDCFDKVVDILKSLEDGETLVLQSGRPVAVFKLHKDAPVVLHCSATIVPHWCTRENFDD